MNLDRMVFAPGDKVMRVGGNRGGTRVLKANAPAPKYGVVYCVKDFHAGRQFNVILLVGCGEWHYVNGRKVGWYAGAFRKVEEIQLCAQAARHAKAKELQPAREKERA